jgi:D-3-phosphoglycerate dehydrogenase
MTVRLSLSRDKISVLLLEGIHDTAVQSLEDRGYTNITRLPKALEEDELIERIRNVHMLGIRSRTQLTERVLNAAEKLFSVGCFCIGTNQVDLKAARRQGVPVFNAPYSNTRSVAELVLGEIIMLMRGIFEKSQIVHTGGWVKSAKNSYEVRGKVLGIVGYGHIGTQLSILAEAVGMRVVFYDIQKKLALGNAQPCASLGELLETSDVVTLHVPDTAQTRGMIGAEEIRRMKKGAFLINAARGMVVEIEALAEALKSGHLLGTAIDVFPEEPSSAYRRIDPGSPGQYRRRGVGQADRIFRQRFDRRCGQFPASAVAGTRQRHPVPAHPPQHPRRSAQTERLPDLPRSQHRRRISPDRPGNRLCRGRCRRQCRRPRDSG